MTVSKIIKPHIFKGLNVWNEARVFVKDIYTVTKTFPADEKFGLTSQIRRAAVSICTNIAEGTERDSEGQLLSFLNMAKGSCCEAENLLILCMDLEFINKIDFHVLESQLLKTQNMLFRFTEKIQSDLATKIKSSKSNK